MHEVSLMENAVRMAVETARASGGARVHRIRLRVGAMSGVVPDALRHSFRAVTGKHAGTAQEQWHARASALLKSSGTQEREPGAKMGLTKQPQ